MELELLDSGYTPPEPAHPWCRIQYLRPNRRVQTWHTTSDPSTMLMMFWLSAYRLDEASNRAIKDEIIRRLQSMLEDERSRLIPTWYNAQREHAAIRAAVTAGDYLSYRNVLSSETRKWLADIEKSEEETDVAVKAWLATNTTSSLPPAQVDCASERTPVEDSTTKTPSTPYLYRSREYSGLTGRECLNLTQVPAGNDNSGGSGRPRGGAQPNSANPLAPPPSPPRTWADVAATPVTLARSLEAQPQNIPDGYPSQSPLGSINCHLTPPSSRRHTRSVSATWSLPASEPENLPYGNHGPSGRGLTADKTGSSVINVGGATADRSTVTRITNPPHHLELAFREETQLPRRSPHRLTTDITRLRQTTSVRSLMGMSNIQYLVASSTSPSSTKRIHICIKSSLMPTQRTGDWARLPAMILSSSEPGATYFSLPLLPPIRKAWMKCSCFASAMQISVLVWRKVKNAVTKTGVFILKRRRIISCHATCTNAISEHRHDFVPSG